MHRGAKSKLQLEVLPNKQEASQQNQGTTNPAGYGRRMAEIQRNPLPARKWHARSERNNETAG